MNNEIEETLVRIIRERGGQEYVELEDGSTHLIYDKRTYLGPPKEIELDQEIVGTIVLSSLTKDIYSDGRSEYEYPLLSNADRLELKNVDQKIAGFRRIVRQTIINRHSNFINGIIISGKPGTGKTYSTTLWISEMIEEAFIEGYSIISGKISPVTLFNYMQQCDPGKVQILDDCDVFFNQESLNILKAALNTRNSEVEDGRDVTWGSRGSINKFSYTSFMIMITNEKFDNVTNDHLKAVLDRVHLFEIPITTHDMFIFNSSIIEKVINNDPDIPNSTKIVIKEFYNDKIMEFVNYDIFKDANINFSIRFVLKIIDLIRSFGNDWHSYSKDYEKLVRFYNLKLGLNKSESESKT